MGKCIWICGIYLCRGIYKGCGMWMEETGKDIKLKEGRENKKERVKIKERDEGKKKE